jgi:hypothetical protein
MLDVHPCSARMNPKSTWLWTAAAAVLFAFIFFYRQYLHSLHPPPVRVLPGLHADAITSVQILPRAQKEIRAEKTNGVWELTAPLVYPGSADRIETLLTQLEQLPFATYISEEELRTHTQPDEEFGIEPAQISLILQHGHRSQIHIGHRTPPGDQVYVQVVGVAGIYVTDAEWLKLLPQTPGDWRSTALADWNHLEFDRLIVTNAGRAQPLELQRNPTNQLWHLVSPTPARADGDKVEQALENLRQVSVQQFIEGPKLDLESLGLQPPELTLTLARGTNTVFTFDFGKTNNANLVYARGHDQSTVVTVSNSLVDVWRASHEVFRNRHLLTLTQPVDEIEIHARDTFQLQRQTSNSWNVVPQGFAADPGLVNDLVNELSGMDVDFDKDSVTDLDLPIYGLARSTAWQYILKSDAKGANPFEVELNIGTNQEGRVYACRVGESFVFGIKPADFERLPYASWQLRDRRIWKFSENDVARIAIQQAGKTRELIRRGTNDWTLAPGSQGMINIFALEETAHQLGDLTAAVWSGHGDEHRADFGLAPAALQLTIELKNGEKRTVEFGGTAPSGFPYAAVTLENQTSIFEFPWGTYQFVQLYLTIPSNL